MASPDAGNSRETIEVDATPVERVSRRVGRAIALMALALVVIAAAGFAYLRQGLPTRPIAAAPTGDALHVSPTPAAYDFVTPTTGWAAYVVVGPTHVPGQLSLFRTTDGAKHWQLQLVGKSCCPDFSPISVRLFAGGRGVMTVGQEGDKHLYRTGDGGAHWSAVATPVANAGGPSILFTGVDAVTFSDASHGWLVAFFSGTRASLFTTQDGGDTWNPLPDLPNNAYGLKSRGRSEFWLGSRSSGPPRVYSSDDGAYDWHSHELPYPPTNPSSTDGLWPTTGQWFTSITLLPGSGVVASASCDCAPSSAFTFTSFDAGMTWRFVPAAPGFVTYRDDFNWWVISASTLYQSTDAGQTWTKVSDKLPTWQFVPHVIDSRHAWASLIVLGGYGLALSNDGGRNWTRATVPQPTFPTS